MEHLDLFYATSKLRYAAEMLARERLFSEKHEIPMLDALLHFTDEPSLVEKHPLPALYHKLVRLYLVGVNEDGFRALQALFMQLHGVLPQNDQAIILAHLINCGIALGRTDVEVNAELLSLYKLAIETESVLDNGRITYTAYSNIVLLAVACGELGWAAGFMARFSAFLADSVREPTEQFCRAHIHHASGELNKAQDCLGQAVFTTPAFDVIARSLLMKILFERYAVEGKDYEFLLGHLNAFEKYIEAKQLSEERRRAYLNAIRFVRKMVGIKSKHVNVTAKEREQLQGRLTETSPITMRDWLRQQIDRFQ
ncbi:MAG: hypothetical protein IT258_13215 [Saprospiraceae bacterium]|nr:hypothetical protein [Saprospiraceae bacterium]